MRRSATIHIRTCEARPFYVVVSIPLDESSRSNVIMFNVDLSFQMGRYLSVLHAPCVTASVLFPNVVWDQ